MTTNIHFILDRSGSMDSFIQDTIGGFNSFIRSQKEINTDKCIFSLYQFDHDYQVIYTDKDIKEVEDLNEHTFVPRGTTALYDAIGRTINNVSQNKYNNDDKIIIVILTDGIENSSVEYSNKSISKLIKKYDTNNNWSFVFLAANQDAIISAGKLGIRGKSSMTFSQNSEKIHQCYSNLSSAVKRVRMTPIITKMLFTDEEQSNAQ